MHDLKINKHGWSICCCKALANYTIHHTKVNLGHSSWMISDVLLWPMHVPHSRSYLYIQTCLEGSTAVNHIVYIYTVTPALRFEYEVFKDAHKRHSSFYLRCFFFQSHSSLYAFLLLCFNLFALTSRMFIYSKRLKRLQI